MMKNLLLAICFVCTIALGYSQNHTCMVPDPTAEERLSMLNDIRSLNVQKNSGTICIPVLPHILTKTDGSGNDANLATINVDLANLNYHFLGTGLEFYFVDGSPNMIANDNLYDNYGLASAISSIELQSNLNAINILYVGYCSACGLNTGGAPSPVTATSVVSREMIWLSAAYSGQPDIFFGPRQFNTLTHEMGHYFNLAHTFATTQQSNNISNPGAESELVVRTVPSANCGGLGGDMFCDTEADPGFIINKQHGIWGGNTQSGFLEDVDNESYVVGDVYKNVMRQGFTDFLREFTPDQEFSMLQTYDFRVDDVNGIGYEYTASPATVVNPSGLTVTEVFNGLELTWVDNASNETGYLIERSETSSTSGFRAVINGGVGENVLSFIDYTAEFQTEYWYRVKASNDGCDDYSNVFHVLESGEVYCIPQTQFNLLTPCYSGSCYNHITNVGIQESASANVLLANPSGFNGVVSDFTGLNIELSQNGCYEMDASFTQPLSEFNVWIDWNQDGDFDDPDELVIHNTLVNGISGEQFMVPVNADLGTTRMRVRVSNMENVGSTPIPADPCNYQTFSEAEDYTIEVVTGAGFEFVYDCNALTGTFTSLETDATAVHNWSFSPGSIPNSSAANPIIQFPDFGEYLITHTVTIGGVTYTNSKTVEFVSAGFTAVENCNQPNHFTFTSDYVDGDHTWYFGDGSNSTYANHFNNYTGSGPFTVTHTVISENCTIVSTQQIQSTNNAPFIFTASLEDDIICNGEDLEITYGGSMDEVSLDLGVTWTSVNPVFYTPVNPSTANQANSNVLVIYARATGSQCQAQVALPYLVHEIPSFQNTSFNDATICNGANHYFYFPLAQTFEPININGTVDNVVFTMDGNPIVTSDWPIVVSPSTTTTYTFEATTPVAGCTTTETVTIEVEQAPDYVPFPDLVVCQGEEIILNPQSLNNVQPTSVAYLQGSVLSTSLNYTYTATQSGGIQFYVTGACGNYLDYFTITVIDINISSIPTTDPSGCMVNDGTITVNATSNGTSPIQYSIDNGVTFQSSNLFTGLAAGSYEVVVADAMNCSTTNATTVILNPLWSVSETHTDVSCFAGADGSIDITVQGGTSPYTYSWSNGATTEDVSNLTADIYSVVVTDASGCQIQTSVTISEPTPMSGGIAVTHSTCNGGNTGALDLTVNGGTPPYTYSWSNGSTSQDLSSLPGATYNVTITDDNSCTLFMTANVNEPSQGLTVSETHTDVSCFGGNDGSIDISVTGGTAPYTYLWNNLEITEDITNLIADIYTIVVVDANSCTEVLSVTVSEPALALTASASQTDVSCSGGTDGSIDITVQGGTSPYTYSWSNGANTEDISNLTASTYNVVVTDAAGCQIQTSVTIIQPLPISGGIAVSHSICNGGSTGALDLTVVGGTPPYTYSWSNGFTTQDLSSLPGGTYNVTVTDANSCTLFMSATVNEPSLALSASSTQIDESCVGCTDGSIDVTVQGGTPPYSYFWNNGELTQDISNLTSGTYVLVIVDDNGCTINISVTIAVASSPLIATASQTDVSCNGGADGSIDLTVQGGTSPYTYSWSNTATTEDISNLIAGTYSVTVTDANTNTTSLNVTILEPMSVLSATETHMDVSCNGGADGSTDLSVQGGTPPYTFAWSSGATTEDLSNLMAGTYSVTVADANGCTVSLSVTITQPSLVFNPVLQDDIICYGEDLVVSYTGTIDEISFDMGVTWTSNNPAIFSPVNPSTGNLANSNVLQIFARSNYPTCNNNLQVALPYLVHEIPSFQNTSFNDASICNGANHNFYFPSTPWYEPINNNGGWAPVVFTIDGTPLSYPADWPHIVSPSTTTTYTFEAKTPVAGCTTTETVTIEVEQAPDYSPFPDLEVCQGEVVSLTAQSLNSVQPTSVGYYESGTGATLSTSLSYTFTAIQSGGIQFYVTGACGNYLDYFTVTVIDINISSVNTVGPTGCAVNDGTITINATSNGTSPLQYSIDNGVTFQSSNVFTGLVAGSYDIVVSNGLNCSTTTSTILTPQWSVTETHTDVSCLSGIDGSIDITVIGGVAPYTYLWSNAETTEDISNLIAGTYDVTVTDADGCTVSLSVIITEPASVLTASETHTDVVCVGAANGSIDLTVQGGTAPYSYLWSTSETTEDISNLTEGTYDVTVTDAIGCTVSLTVTISESMNALSASEMHTDVSCFAGADGSIDITVQGGTSPYTYSWSNGATTEDVSSLMEGTYNVVVTDAAGCQIQTFVTITEPTPMSGGIAVTHSTCNGGNTGALDLTVNGGTPPYTYSWSNGSTSQDLSSLSGATYNVTITDDNSCTLFMTANVNEPSQGLTLSETHIDVSCFGGNDGSIDISVTGGTAPYTYLWNNLETTEDISMLIAGNYTVVVVDANSCTAVLSVTITEPIDAINVIEMHSNVSCHGGADGSIDLSVQGGTAPHTYLWSNGDVTEDVLGLTEGTYSVTVTDANSCSVSLSIIITEPAFALSVSETHVDASCMGSADGSIDLSVQGGTSPYSYYWSNGDFTQDITNLAGGTYFVVVEDVNSCSVSLSVTISDLSPIMAIPIVVQPVSCLGLSDAIGTFSISGGTPPYSVDWGGLNSNALPAGVHSVEITDATGCMVQVDITIDDGLPCCFAAISPEYTDLLADFGTEIDLNDPNTNGIVVLSGKYYVSDFIYIENVTLDITNCDLVFAECAELSFGDNSVLRANNSVFRPCEENGTWRGINLNTDNAAVNIFNENTVKNAWIGLNINGETSARVQNNLFQNCNAGLGIVIGDMEHPVAGNSFIFDQDIPNYVDLDGLCGPGDWHFGNNIGIILGNANSKAEIAQNTFVNNHSDEAIGIAVTFSSQNGKISENTFTDFTHAISFAAIANIPSYIDQSSTAVAGGRFTIENNEIETSRIFEHGAAQIQINSSQAIISIVGNEINTTFSESSEPFHGIELSKASNVEVNSNIIRGGFQTGIFVEGGGYCNIVSNEITDFTVNGIYLNEQGKSAIRCNTITGNDVKSTIGVQVGPSCSHLLIYSNCVFNTQTAINCDNDALPPLNTNNGRFIDIRDNYLFNYQYGVANYGYNGLNIGLYGYHSGQNTFWSNHDQGYDIVSFSGTPTFASDNFGVTQTSGSVTLKGLNGIYSTAACGNQVMQENQQQSNLNPIFTCHYPYKNWINEFQVAQAKMEVEDYTVQKARYEYVLSTAIRLQGHDEALTQEWIATVNSANILNEYYTKLFDYEVALLNGDVLEAYEILDNVSFLDDDRLLLYPTLLQLRNQLGMLDLAHLDDQIVNNLRDIAQVEDSRTNLARSILMNHYGESYLYVNKLDYNEIPEIHEADRMTITDDVSLSLYPNPAKDILDLQLSLGDFEAAELKVFNAIGQQVLGANIDFVAGKTSLNVADLASGTYIISITNGKEFVKQAKFVKQ